MRLDLGDGEDFEIVHKDVDLLIEGTNGKVVITQWKGVDYQIMLEEKEQPLYREWTFSIKYKGGFDKT